jgi:hypothetical protein
MQRAWYEAARSAALISDGPSRDGAGGSGVLQLRASKESASDSSDWPPKLGAPRSSLVPAASRASIVEAGCRASRRFMIHTPSRPHSNVAALSTAVCATSPLTMSAMMGGEEVEGSQDASLGSREADILQRGSHVGMAARTAWAEDD